MSKETLRTIQVVTAATTSVPAVQPRRCFDLDRPYLCPGRAPCADEVADKVDRGLGLETGRLIVVVVVAAAAAAMLGIVEAAGLFDRIALVRADSWSKGDGSMVTRLVWKE
jgi:hypothetical protein